MRCEIESGWKLEVVRVALALFVKGPTFHLCFRSHTFFFTNLQRTSEVLFLDSRVEYHLTCFDLLNS